MAEFRVVPNPHDGTSTWAARVVRGEGVETTVVASFREPADATLFCEMKNAPVSRGWRSS